MILMQLQNHILHIVYFYIHNSEKTLLMIQTL